MAAGCVRGRGAAEGEVKLCTCLPCVFGNGMSGQTYVNTSEAQAFSLNSVLASCQAEHGNMLAECAANGLSSAVCIRVMRTSGRWYPNMAKSLDLLQQRVLTAGMHACSYKQLIATVSTCSNIMCGRHTSLWQCGFEMQQALITKCQHHANLPLAFNPVNSLLCF